MVDPFDIKMCQRKFILHSLEKKALFPRLLNTKTKKDAEVTAHYCDMALVSVNTNQFQNVLLNMQFESTFYSLFSGRSKKVCCVIFLKHQPRGLIKLVIF